MYLFMRSLSAERNAFFVRILITITPRMYREVFALSIHRRRPDFKVLLAHPLCRAERFRPHVLVQDACTVALPPDLPDGVLCRIKILDTGRMDAAIELDGSDSEVNDVSLEDLFAVLERAESLLLGGGSGRSDRVLK